jgi:hypothetical protein
MRTIRNSFGGLAIIGGLIASLNFVHAQTTARAVQSISAGNMGVLSVLAQARALAASEPVLEQSIPVTATGPSAERPSGTYWSLQSDQPPMPFDPFPELPVYVIDPAKGILVVDDRSVDFSALRAQQEEQAQMQAMAMDMPSPGDGGGDSGTNGFSNSNYVQPDYGTNLWIAQVGISSGSLVGIVSNSSPDISYEIQSLTDLAQAGAGWGSEGFILGSELTNWTPMSVAMNNRTNLFVRIKSWADSTGSGIPDWWQLQYFVYVGIDPYADPDGDGYNNLEEFLNGTDPTVFDSPPKGVSNVQALNSVSGGTTNVVVSWQSPSSSVTNYTIVRTSGTNVTTYTVSGNVSSWTDTNAPAGSTYQVAANYPSGSAGSSPTADPTYNPLLAIDPEIVRGPAPSSSSLTPLQIVLGGIVPTNVTAIRVHKKVSPLVYNRKLGDYYWWLYWYAGDKGWSNNFPGSLKDGSFDVPISSFVNGIYQIPVSQLPEWCAYYFQMQPIASDGRGGITNAAVFARNVPFVDGSVVLKDNLSFNLRAAQAGDPNRDVSIFDFEANANYVAVSPYIEHMDISPDLVTEVAAFNDNWFMRNWEYDADFDYFFDSYNGNTYYFFFGNKNLGPYGGHYANPTNGWPEYQFNGYSYVNTQNAALLNSQLTNNSFIFLQIGVPDEIGFSPYFDLLIEAGLFWDGSQTHLTSGYANDFGLTYQSVRVTESQNPLGVQHDIPAGGSYADPLPDDYSEYFQKVSAPSLTTVGYYFAQSSDPKSEVAATLAPMPNDPNFSVTNTTPLIIAAVGQPCAVYGWAKQSIVTVSGKYAYLGQYFDKAYTTDGSGNATGTQTGILSEYGDFFATEPGKVILKTKADPDQGGSQGPCPVYAVSLNVDANHDGNMDLSFGGPDNTSQSNPMRFWVNNDSDYTEDSANDPGHDAKYMKDCDDWGIGSQRDLEDFARLWICGVPALTNGAYQVTLSWANVASGTPIINLFDSVDTNGGVGYLTDTNVAKAQVRNYPLFNSPGWKVDTISPSHSFTFPANYFTNAGNKYFLFEGAGIGAGQLMMTISQNGNTIAETGVWLDLHDIKDFYEQVQATNVTSGYPPSDLVSQYSVMHYGSGMGDETKQVIVYVHGINRPPWGAQNDGETIFKRLYWSGYHGHYALFRWPCTYLPPNNWWPYTFNQSEFYAYKSATALKNYLTDLRSRPDLAGYAIDVFAHSQGSAVVSEAFSQGAPFDNCILTQGAVPAQCYDGNAPTVPALMAAEAQTPTPYYYTQGGYQECWTNISGNIVSFFNTNDFALVSGGYGPKQTNWEVNQATQKPESFNLGPIYSYWPASGTSFRSTLGGGDQQVTDYQEIRSMVARSHTAAIGAQGPADGQTRQGIISGSVDLKASFGFDKTRQEHSAQFTRPIQTGWPYYDQVLTSFRINHIAR